jgi:hypothetical protein
LGVHKDCNNHCEEPSSECTLGTHARFLRYMIRCQLVTQSPNDESIHDMTRAAAFAIRATVHGTNKYGPGHLLYQRDMIQRLTVEANEELMRHRREKNRSRISKQETKF